MNTITADSVSHRYKQVNSVEGISFSIPEGELFGFIGPDGAGKTTLFRILATLLIPASGKAEVNGFNVVKDYKKIRRIIGYMPGRFSLYMDLSVEENLAFYATIFGTTIKENYHLIKDIYSQIEPFKKRKAGDLSGGMKQKLALSCALIHKPAVILLDEPTTGVDAVSRVEFWEMLRRLKESGICILVSTPYMDEAGLCDRVALMQNGKIMKIEQPGQVTAGYPFHLFSVSSSDIYRLITDLKDYPDVYSVYAFGQSAHLAFGEVMIDRSALHDFLHSKGHNKIIIENIKPTIEDCFMELMTAPPLPEERGQGGKAQL